MRQPLQGRGAGVLSTPASAPVPLAPSEKALIKRLLELSRMMSANRPRRRAPHSDLRLLERGFPPTSFHSLYRDARCRGRGLGVERFALALLPGAKR